MKFIIKRVISHSILFRYIISYIAIIAILILGVSLYVNHIFAVTIHENIVEENTNRLSALRIQHEEKLTSMLNIGNQIGISPYITPFKLKEAPLMAFHLKQQLNAYTASDDFFDQLYIKFHSDDYLYSPATSVSTDIFAESLMLYENINADSIKKLLNEEGHKVTIIPGQRLYNSLTVGNSKQMVTFIVPIRVDGRFNMGNALFFVQESKYQQLFADEISQLRNMYIFHGEEIISCSRPINISDDVIRGIVSSSDDSIIEKINIDNVNYLVFVQKGSMFGLNYVSVIPQETVEINAARSRMRFGLFLLLLSIPCALLTVYFARKHVQPIKELQKSFGGEPGEDGFIAIRSGIEDLRGQNRALSMRLDQSKQALKGLFVKNFVNCVYESREQAVTAAKELGIDIDRSYYCVSLMTVPKKSKALEQLYSLTESRGDVTGYGIDIVYQEQYLFVTFSNSKEALEKWAEAVKSVLITLDTEAVVAVSNFHTDFSKATSAYLEASTAYDNRFVMGSEYVLWFSDVSAAAKVVEPLPQGYIDGFRKALHAGDQQAINDRIDELFQILSERKVSLFAFRVVYNDIISILLNKYMSNQNDHSNTIQYYDIFELARCRRVSDLVEILRQLCNDIMSADKPDATSSQSLVEQVTNYLRENYTDPGLTMGAIADIYGINATQLSQEYRAKTGMYPSKYLLQLRMEKARELLQQTNMPIHAIGVTVGYNDASSFIRRFKKHMGVTPAQYRQSLQDKPAFCD